MDLTLRDGTSLQDAIATAKEIDVQSKQSGFYQEALDQVARQGYANVKFEMEVEEGLDVVDEFYSHSEQEDKARIEPLHVNAATFKKELVRSVRAVN